ncbi:MAG: DUF2520 domain-containing protein [Legionellaceae bacterium]|nr:DUF2520 domain-containing protein [Legionellaceae bacterium]
MDLSVNIIGTGNLGKTIGKLIIKNSVARIQGIFNRSQNSSKNAIQFIGSGTLYSDITSLPNADITFITTPDDTLEEVCLQFSHNKNIKPGAIIVHCSGALSSDVLEPMKHLGCYVASVHPMHSFAQPALSVEQYSGTFCAVEGDKEALDVMIPVLNAIGSVNYSIDKEKKHLYHAAGVFASNYVVTLAQQALVCLRGAGVENDIAMRVITNLMMGSVLNLQQTLSPEKSLTGPIQRGDTLTVQKHLQALDYPKQQALYAMLGQITLDLTHHSREKQEALRALFVGKKEEVNFEQSLRDDLVQMP